MILATRNDMEDARRLKTRRHVADETMPMATSVCGLDRWATGEVVLTREQLERTSLEVTCADCAERFQ